MSEPLRCAECAEGTMVLRDSRFGKFYGCTNFPTCKGAIGAHQAPPYLPLGKPADRETKQLRIAVHERIDPLWRGQGKGARARLYAALSKVIGKPYHTGECDADTCRTILGLIDKGWQP